MLTEREHTRLSKHNRVYWRQGGTNYWIQVAAQCRVCLAWR